MKQILIKQGHVVVEDIPAPQVQQGSILVDTAYSCVSAGTEMSGVRAGAGPLWKRALQQPEQVLEVLRRAMTAGMLQTYKDVTGQLSTGATTGYSLAGIVLEVGAGIEGLRPGDPVACAGAQCAHHAEVVCVPRNLAVPVPDGLALDEACTVTLGAIALQGVRRASPTLGETFVVIGLGLLGQLTAQLLRANGCRVIGTDLDPERVRLAEYLGMDASVLPAGEDDISRVARLTNGMGADGVIITAATTSNEVVSTAFKMCRKKGRVVLVGDVGLVLNRADFYAKELDFFISTSYGPGRYDRNYEELNLDYPFAYVRWTENRNMAEYLKLLGEGRLNVRPLMQATYDIDNAAAAYSRFDAEDPKPLIVLLRYPEREREQECARKLPNPTAKSLTQDRIRVALVGAGSFGQGTHLPNLRRLADRYTVRAIVSRNGATATQVARQYDAAYSATDYERALADSEVDLVMIATRHNLHASMALQALEAGKHVFVEKPLALNREELARIVAFYEEREGRETPVLMTGFNRRFSSYAQRIKAITDRRTNPMIINYRMNAGYFPLDHWVHGEEGGGRNLGEACHIYDLFTFLTNSRVVSVETQVIRPSTRHYACNDNFVASMRFEDGSVAVLTYTALGAKEAPKELMDVYVDGMVLTLRDYRELTVTGSKAPGLKTRATEKGHMEQIVALASAAKVAGEWPIALWQQVQATEIALQVEAHIQQGCRQHGCCQTTG